MGEGAYMQHLTVLLVIGVRAGGARGAEAPPNFGQLSFFGQQQKIWAKPPWFLLGYLIILKTCILT